MAPLESLGSFLFAFHGNIFYCFGDKVRY